MTINDVLKRARESLDTEQRLYENAGGIEKRLASYGVERWSIIENALAVAKALEEANFEVLDSGECWIELRAGDEKILIETGYDKKTDKEEVTLIEVEGHQWYDEETWRNLPEV